MEELNRDNSRSNPIPDYATAPLCWGAVRRPPRNFLEVAFRAEQEAAENN